ncbi:hypothetical protein Ahy_A07g036442 isoform B [Arachis hypogaea]|uniref:Uncharacterized protein n=1 Tax=Arachis hypogaea TaxID=3818 RepID=A0A445CG69_ARAHY|nr:hypothetical protein Ahy_A07g036442 isoform B [Arachis hypogaea]
MSNSSGYVVVYVYPNCRMRNSDNRLIFECVIRYCCALGEVGYRLLVPLENGVSQFRLFCLHSDEHVCLMFDIHWRIMTE